MRRRNISVLLAVPAANALSLANFQTITSILIPFNCQLAYDSQIPSCTVSDFNNGCSAACVAGLNSIARSVSQSCSNVEVSSRTLLGIVQDGDIVVALCPQVTAQVQPTMSVIVQSSTPAAQPAAVSVTIPTGGAGVTGGLGFKTTSTSTSTPIPVPQSEVTTSTTQQAKTTKTTTTAKSVESAAGGLGGSPATTSTTTSVKRTTTTAATQTNAPQDKSGGGSPFDVQSNDATRDMGTSMIALVVAMFAVVVIGR